MKIKFENFLDKTLEKLNLKRINKKEKGEVINFEAEVEKEKIRNGANIEKDENLNDKKIKRQGVKILTSMILLLMLSISLGINNMNNIRSNVDIVPIDVSSVATSATIEDENEEIEETETQKNEIVLATKYVEKKKEEEKLIFTKPLDGEIQKMYSVDKVIYSKTLSQWKTHDGLDISANVGTDVKAIERGVVTEIYNDSFLGTTIVIEHIAGYESKYSNLSEDVYVKLGESVIKGQKIGKVGNTSVGEYLDEPHLHFMILQNGKSINPTYLYD